MSATAMVYKAAGMPQMEGDRAGMCRSCGIESVGLPFSQWVKDTFTNHDLLTVGLIICHACLFCFAEQNPTLTAKVKKDKPQKCRSYSHFVVNGEWFPLSKGEKAKVTTPRPKGRGFSC